MDNEFPITIKKGARFQMEVSYVDDNGVAIPLNGYVASMKIKQTYDSTNAVLNATPYLALNGVLGVIDVDIPGSITGLLTAPFQGLYDLFISTNTDSQCLAHGVVFVEPSVTV